MEAEKIKNSLLIIIGPTSVGKSKYAFEYAKAHDGEIISADSMQIYRGMNIGTDKPDKKTLKEVPHHLIDIKNPDEDFSVAEFLDRVKSAIIDIHSKNKLPIIVGGSGMYLAALIDGYSLPMAKANEDFRNELYKKDKDELYLKLKKVDPIAADKIHPNNVRRIIRALEVYELTGKPISSLQKKKSFINEYDYKIIGLNTKREKLYKKIDDRADKMIKNGLVDEVEKLLPRYKTTSKPFLQALGYKEVIGYIQGKYRYEEMIEILKKNTRHFARRQMTWFKRFKGVEWMQN